MRVVSVKMRVVSVNTGLPRTVRWNGQEVRTGIFKSAADGPVLLRRLNFDGDGQADLQNHGGVAKAMYAYPHEHYGFWQERLPDTALPHGAFGENLTTEGLRETETCIGDRFRIGEAVVMATQPRIPCFKLGIRLGHDEIVDEFLCSHRSGIYFAVIEEGLVRANDTIEKIHRETHGITVTDINRAYAYFGADGDYALVRRALETEALGPGLREHFRKKLAVAEGREVARR